LVSGEKNFELRYDDRGFRAGDILLLREWSKRDGYSGNEIQVRLSLVAERISQRKLSNSCNHYPIPTNNPLGYEPGELNAPDFFAVVLGGGARAQ
jgi:hypothetical protein